MNEHDSMTLLSDANPVRPERLGEPPGDLLDSILTGPGRHTRRLVIAAAAVAVIFAAVAALAATGTLSGRATQTSRPTVQGDQSPGAGLFSYFHSGGALSSIAVTLTPNISNASVQLEVVHSDATSYAKAYAGSPQVVFREQLSTTPSPASSFAYPPGRHPLPERLEWRVPARSLPDQVGGCSARYFVRKCGVRTRQ